MTVISSDFSEEKRAVLSIMGMTTHNGPGIRTLVLFKGCPLRCVWCSTPESQLPEPEIAIEPQRCTNCGSCVPVCPLNGINLHGGTIRIDRAQCQHCGECVEVCYPEAIRLLGRYMTVEDLLQEVRKDIVFYRHSGGGVTFSGGEPLIQPNFTRKLLKVCKEEGINVGIDTCGYVPWSNIEHALPYVDFFLFDIKQMNSKKHRRITGVPNGLILKNARSISEKGIPIYVRVPVIPGYTDSDCNIRAISHFASNLSSLIEVHLLPFHHLGKRRYQILDRPYPMEEVPLIDRHTMQDMQCLVESYGVKCSIVG